MNNRIKTGRSVLGWPSFFYDMKFTIKSIIRWEQMTGKPFSSLNYGNEEDIISLFYACGPMNTTLEDYKKALTPETIKDYIADFEKQTAISSQFQKKKIITKKSGNKTDIPEKHLYIREIIPVLIMKGLDATYALNEMDICDLPIYLDAYESLMKESLETKRLFSYMIVSPHLSKKVKSPKDIFPFSWELEEIKQEAAKSIEEGKSDFEIFMSSGNSLLK